MTHKKLQNKEFQVQVEALTFETIIGILDFERTTPQQVVVDITFSYQFQDDFINYAEVASLIKEKMQTEKYFLIEDALVDLKQTLQEKFPSMQKIFLKIQKPSILPDCKVSVSI